MDIIEVIIEVVLVLAIVGASCVVAARSVRLKNRTTTRRYRYTKKSLSRSLARTLNDDYAAANEEAPYETATVIMLPSASSAWLAGGVVGPVVSFMMLFCHIHGAAQLLIDVGMNTHMAFCLSAVFLGFLGSGCGAITSRIIPLVQVIAASEIADKRLKEGHKVVFDQEIGLDEKAVAFIAQLIHRIRYRKRRQINRHN